MSRRSRVFSLTPTANDIGRNLTPPPHIDVKLQLVLSAAFEFLAQHGLSTTN